MASDKYIPGKGDSYWKPSFLVSILVFGGVICEFASFFQNKQIVWKAFAACLLFPESWSPPAGHHRDPPVCYANQKAAKITMVSRATCHFKISFWQG